MNLSGAPKTVFDIKDASIIKDTPVAGFIIVQGITQRGRRGIPYLITNSLQFARLMGAEFTADKFPTFVNRILNGGGKLYIIRALHYTDPTDASTVVGTKATAAITASSHTSNWVAEEVGDGYNGSTIVITAAASGTAAKVDLKITLKDSDISTVITDVAQVLDANGISDLNNKLDGLQAGVRLASIVTQIEPGTGTLASGAITLGGIVAADYVGSSVGGTGWAVANSVTAANRIANIGIESEVVDEGLRVYVEGRQDMRFIIHTPLGVNSAGMAAYRNGTTPYSHTAMDTMWGTLIAGDLNITDTLDTNKNYNIPGAVDVLYLKARSDQQNGPWFAAAGGKRGRILMPNNGVPYNLGSAALSGDYDTIYPMGVNAVINDQQFGPVYWGNRSLKKDVTSLLSRDNVCDLIVDMIRILKPLVRIPMFDPNDPQMWKEIYRRVRPSIQDYESRRAIQPGEDQAWFWIGDQTADVSSDAKFNVPADLDAGRYRARFVFVPLTATEFIGIELVATDSGSVNFVVQENPTL